MNSYAPLPAKYMGGNWSLDQGVDINGGTSAIAHAPLLAIGAGTIVNHGIGGFGPDAPILKLDQPINGQQYVYYGHAGPGNKLPVGTHVAAGDIIGEVGAGIVGMSSGPHLEIGFSDARGTPVGGTSGIMAALLHRATQLTGGHNPAATVLQQKAGKGTSLDVIPSPSQIAKDIVDGLFGGITGKETGPGWGPGAPAKGVYAGLVLIAVLGAFVFFGRGISRTTHAEGAPA